MRGDFASFSCGEKQITIAQLEIVDGKKMVQERKEEILAVLRVLKQEQKVDIIFLSIVNFGESYNIFVTDDLVIQQFLEKVLSIYFTDHVAERSPVLMRKQIVPLLKEEMEK